MEVHILDNVLLFIQVNSSCHFRIRAPSDPDAILSEVHTSCCPTVIGCNKALCRTKQDRSYPFHRHHLQLLYSQVMLCGMALSSHTGKKFLNLCWFADVWCVAVAVTNVCDSP